MTDETANAAASFTIGEGFTTEGAARIDLIKGKASRKARQSRSRRKAGAQLRCRGQPARARLMTALLPALLRALLTSAMSRLTATCFSGSARMR
jgi:hypothetical protein